MRYSFVKNVLEKLLEDKTLSLEDDVLVVAGAKAETELFQELGFRSVTISNLDDRMVGDEVAPFKWSYQDAQNLALADRSFDFAFVSDGLHHCSSPHSALLEMYRVSKKGVVVFESRDSFLMKVANRAGLTPSYELEAVIDNDFAFGGVDNSEIPNYIYRWTEREFEKAIRSYDPIGKQTFRYFYGLNLPYSQAQMKKSSFKSIAIHAADPFVRLFTKLFKRQCNSFCMVALRPDLENDLWPWLRMSAGEPRFNRRYAKEVFKTPHD